MISRVMRSYAASPAAPTIRGSMPKVGRSTPFFDKKSVKKETKSGSAHCKKEIIDDRIHWTCTVTDPAMKCFHAA